jgi:hypothetical protein
MMMIMSHDDHGHDHHSSVILLAVVPAQPPGWEDESHGPRVANDPSVLSMVRGGGGGGGLTVMTDDDDDDDNNDMTMMFTTRVALCSPCLMPVWRGR